MAEGSKVTLVRCPNCENLLPQLPDYSVYECDGCGAVLRAKKKMTLSGGILEKPERDEDGFEKLENLSEKEGGCLGNASETERENDGVLHNRRKDRVFKKGNVQFDTSSLSMKENNCALIDTIRRNRNGKEQHMGYQSGAGEEKFLKHPIGYRFSQVDDSMNVDRSESVSSSRERFNAEISAQPKISGVSLQTRVTMDQQDLDTDGVGRRNLRTAGNRSKFSTFAYPDERPSNYNLASSSYGSSESVRNYLTTDGPNRIAYLEQDRAELLRKLDELQEQLSKSCSVSEKQRERSTIYSKISPQDPYHDRDTYNSSMLPMTPDKRVARPPYFKHHGHGSAPYVNSHDMNLHNFYIPPEHSPNEIPASEDSLKQQTPRVHFHQQPGQYWREPPNDYFTRQHMNFGRKTLVSYPSESLHHPHACPCFHCCNKNWHIPSQAPPTSFGSRKFSRDSTYSNFNCYVNSVTYGPQVYDPQANLPALHPRDLQPHVIWPSDAGSDVNGFCQSLPRRVVIACGNERLCYPIAGGAPFISCYNCFELLKLPRKLKEREKNQQKLRCGACSVLILLKIENKRLIASVPKETKQTFAEADDSSHDVSQEVILNNDVRLNAAAKNCSDDIDNPGYDFQSADFKDNSVSEDLGLNIDECVTRQGHASLSSISSKEEGNLDSMVAQRDLSYTDQLPTKDEIPPTFQGSPFQVHSGDVSSNRAVIACEEGNEVGKTEQEKVIHGKGISWKSSLEDVTMPTEVEVPPSEYLHTSLSQDSVEISKEEDSLRNSKGRESFLVGLVKKSFRDFSRSNQHLDNEEPNVFVNGKPIPGCSVRNAEKLAGPIQPGDYWYDVRAGFWGVMGQPCLGIIPPFIEEFNYPMPEHCAAGNTGVFVNGRELHQRDLDLLASRGLPTTGEKFYIVEISGRVLDEVSGEELDNLGRLAPTVEKAKRGFGMKVKRKAL